MSFFFILVLLIQLLIITISLFIISFIIVILVIFIVILLVLSLSFSSITPSVSTLIYKINNLQLEKNHGIRPNLFLLCLPHLPYLCYTYYFYSNIYYIYSYFFNTDYGYSVVNRHRNHLSSFFQKSCLNKDYNFIL